MSNIEKICRELWAVVVKLRDRHCQICGAPTTDTHHIFFLSQGDWAILYDPDFGVGLCHDCHEEKEYAPHKNNRLFFEKIIPILLQKAAIRAKKILTYKISIKKPNPLNPPWRIIKKLLRTEFKRLQETSWMDADIDCSRGASI